MSSRKHVRYTFDVHFSSTEEKEACDRRLKQLRALVRTDRNQALPTMVVELGHSLII